MCLASVASSQEHKLLQNITKGAETWLGACRKGKARNTGLGGADDWEWIDGTAFVFTQWNATHKTTGEDRITMKLNAWYDCASNKLLPGIYQKRNYSPPYETIRALVTNQNLLRECFAASNEIRNTLLRILYYVFTEKSVVQEQMSTRKGISAPRSRVQNSVPNNSAPKSSPPSTSASVPEVVVMHLKSEWPNLTAAFQAVQHSPLSTHERHRAAFLAYFVTSSAILHAPAPNAWHPIPASVDDWSWPPAPLVPLRAAAKLVQKLGPETVKALWPVIATAIVGVLIRIVDAVKSAPEHASEVLTAIFDRERKSSLDTYQKQLRRARRDPTFPEFKGASASVMSQLEKFNRKELRVQTASSFSELYSTAHSMLKRFNVFLANLAQKCSSTRALQAPLKGMGRALEKLVLRPGAADKVKMGGMDALDSTTLVDVLRGSLECPDFTEIVFILELLVLLDVDMGNAEKAKAQGWDLDKFQIRIVHIKDRFTTPTSGGWADAMVNFTFAHGDDTFQVMELQIQVRLLIIGYDRLIV